MPINKFKITELPLKATIEIDGIAAIVNQEYPISKQADMIIEVFGVGVPYDSFLYFLGDSDGVWSRPIEAIINAEPDTGTPAVTPYSLDVESNVITDITSSIVFDQYTDRILFPQLGASKISYGNIRINGSPLLYDYPYMIDDISIEFFSDQAGDGENLVTTISVQYGNINGYSATAVWTITGTGNMMATILTNSTIS